MLLLAFLLFLAQSSGSPAYPADISTSSSSLRHLLRRAPWDHPNPETGLCDCPNTRNVAEIVWTCASTLILATWVSVHLNVPPKGASPFRLAVLRFGAMFATILGPEITLWWALTEWRGARTVQKKMVAKYPMWTMTHSFYVVMGGFALYDGKENINRPIHPDDFPTHVEQRFTFPTITEEEIKDKSKGDGLAKTIAVIQLLWFSVQLIGRLIKGWAATELEVLTFATSIMTVVIYFFWWNKPLDVHCQTILDPIQLQAVADDAHTDSVIEESEKTRDYRQEIKSFFTSNPKPQHLFHRKIFELELSLDSFFKVVGFPLVFLWEILSKTDDSTWGPDCANPVSPFILDHTGDAFWETYTPFFTAALFGAMHFITWSFSMPTVGELWLWRSASIALTALPLLSLLCGLVGEPLDDSDRPIARVLADLFVFLGIGCATLHPMIRLVIAIHSVVLLRELPDTAFLVLSWSDSIPSL